MNATRTFDLEKRLLQACVALAALVPVSAGLTGVWAGPGMLGLGDAPSAADSHFRYLSGLLFAIGLAFWTTVPLIERKAARFRVLAAMVVIGGLGRAISLAVAGTPTPPMIGGLVMELGVTPLLALWQTRIARRAKPL